MADMDYNYSGDVVSGVEPAKKHTGAVIGGVTAGVLAVAVGGGIAAYNMSDLVKNQVKLTISKPDEYYSWVVEKNTNEMASQISEAYSDYLDKKQYLFVKNGINLNFDLSNDSKVLVKEGTDNLLSDLSSVTLDIESAEVGKSLISEIKADVNGKNVISTEMQTDYATGDTFLRIPELSVEWLVFSSGLDEAYFDQYNSFNDANISAEQLETLIATYSDFFIQHIPDVEITKNAELKIDNIDVKYTTASLHLDEEDTDEFIEEFLKFIKNDRTTREIIVDDLKLVKGIDYEEAVDEALKETLDSLLNSTDITTYIDAAGTIRGFTISEGQKETQLLFGMDGSEIRGEYTTTDLDDNVETRVDIALSEKEKNLYDGTITVLSGGEEAVVNLDNITVVNEKKGYVSGNISFEIEDQKYNLALTADENSQSVSSDIVVDGTNYGKLTATFSQICLDNPDSDVYKTSVKKADAFDVYGEDANFPSDYVEQEKMVEFAKEVLMNIGLDEATADELAVEFGDSIYTTYNAWGDDDYVWEDDWDEEFDWDEEYYDWDEDEFIDDSDIYWDEDFSDDMDIFWDEDFDIDMSDVEIPEIDMSGIVTFSDVDLS